MHEAINHALAAGGGVLRVGDHPALRHRLRHARERGWLLPVFRGIHARREVATHFEVRVRALFVADPDAVLIGPSAEVFHGWRTASPDEPVHAASQRIQGDRPGFVLTRRRIDPGEIVERGDTPRHTRATSEALTTLDLARSVGGGAIDAALRRAGRHRGTLARLVECLRGQRGRRGNRHLRLLLHDSRDEPWSEAERSGHRSLRAGRITDWRANWEIRCTTGRRVYADIAFPALRLAIEIDGWEFHRSRDSFELDRLRDLDLRHDGWDVVRLPARWVMENPGLFAQAVTVLVRRRRALLERAPAPRRRSASTTARALTPVSTL